MQEQQRKSDELDPDRMDASAFQHAWMDLIDAARAGLTKKCGGIHEMMSSDIQALSLACHNFFWLEYNVRTADKQLADSKADKWTDPC